MTAEERYKEAKSRYAGIAVDTDRARTPEELMEDIDKVLALAPGRTKLNLHASYAVFEDGVQVDRDRLQPRTGMSSGRGVFC